MRYGTLGWPRNGNCQVLQKGCRADLKAGVKLVVVVRNGPPSLTLPLSYHTENYPIPTLAKDRKIESYGL